MAENDIFESYMKQNWPEKGPPPPDAVDYIKRGEKVDFLNGGIYRFCPVSVEDFLKDPLAADKSGSQRTRFRGDDISLVGTPDEELTATERQRKELARTRLGGSKNVMINAKG